MRRSLLLLASVVSLAATFTAPAAASAVDSCAAASSATYRHTFNGASGQATITAVRPLCSGQTQSFGLISYTVGSGGQFTYATDRATISASNRSVNLDVVVPPCRTQVIAITGTALLDTVTADDAYGAKTLGATGNRSTGRPAVYRGGSTDCSPAPEVTFTSTCEGTYRATLTNAVAANVSAAFLVGGRLIRLAPGRSTTVDGPTGGTLTIKDSSFTTYVGSWRPPTSACTTTPAQIVTTPVAAPTRSTDAAAPPAPPKTSPAAATTTDTGNAPAYYVTPTPAPTTEAEAAGQGLSTGSLLATIFGLLLIGGGGYFLFRVLRTFRNPS